MNERKIEMPKQKDYTNEDIVSLKGADRVRKRPAVIFGSDGIDGCEHSVFEILSNSIDEARDGHGDKIIVTKYNDNSIEVEDFGRGCPVDYNQREKKYNWDDKKYYTVENVVGMDVKEAVKTLSKYNVTYSGSGNKVISQSPKANTRLEEGSTVRLMLGN